MKASVRDDGDTIMYLKRESTQDDDDNNVGCGVGVDEICGFNISKRIFLPMTTCPCNNFFHFLTTQKSHEIYRKIN